MLSNLGEQHKLHGRLSPANHAFCRYALHLKDFAQFPFKTCLTEQTQFSLSVMEHSEFQQFHRASSHDTIISGMR